LLWSLISHLIGVVVLVLCEIGSQLLLLRRPCGRHAEALACYSLLGILLVRCCPLAKACRSADRQSPSM
jgi:hypothetical protein